MVSVAGLAGYATQLHQANAKLVQVVTFLQEKTHKEVLLPWGNADYTAVERLAETTEGLLKAAEIEVTALDAGRKSKAMQEWERSKRDTARRQKKKIEAGAAPKKRGRPPKAKGV